MAGNLAILSGIPLFKLLDESEQQDLIRVLAQRSCAPGEKIFSFGEPGDSLYIVTGGRVELFIKDTTGTKIVLTVCEPGDVFGELSLFDGGSRTASAVSMDESDLLVLDRQDLVKFLRKNPDAALDLLTMMGQRIRATDELLRKAAARNINEEMEVRLTVFQRIADIIAAFSGSMAFLALNAVWFLGWIMWNTIPGLPHFDPYPFGFLTMVVSLEAIFLSIFVLISQNRQTEKDRLRNDTEYAVNLRAELEVAHLHEKIDFLTEELLARLPRGERKNIKAM
jgi:CRP/FNR family transcriptional regulator, cyclic AMP receptor protein